MGNVNLYDFDLHRKTLTVYVFHRWYLLSPYRSLNEIEEQLYTSALQDVLWSARQSADRNKKDRVAVKLNYETAKMLYHHAVMATGPDGDISNLTAFPVGEDGLTEIEEDLAMIVAQCKGIISLRSEPDIRLKKLKIKIAKECRVVA
jgi:hypothetical protein